MKHLIISIPLLIFVTTGNSAEMSINDVEPKVKTLCTQKLCQNKNHPVITKEPKAKNQLWHMMKNVDINSIRLLLSTIER